jgi:hypothetical protein
MHADDEGVDHRDSRIMRGGKCIYDSNPHGGPSPAYELVPAGGVWVAKHQSAKIEPAETQGLKKDIQRLWLFSSINTDSLARLMSRLSLAR